MEKLRILFLSAANSVHTVRWVNALAERRYQVVLISQKDHMDKKHLISPKVKILYLPIKGKKGYYFNAIFLNKIYKKIHFDVVNVHYASGYGTLARMAKLPNVLLSIWGSDVYDFPYESKIKEKILKKNLAYASLLASTSYCMSRQVRKIIGEKEIIITPFGVDIEKFKKSDKKDKELFVVGTVKTLLPKYGIDLIITSFYLFIKKLENKIPVQLVIYGEGSQKEELVSLCKSLGILNRVSFKGYIPNQEVPKVLNEMDIVCFGSRLDSESFGVAAVEAMACELPIVATKVDGFQEVIEDGVTGYLVTVDDAEEMAESILRLYHDEKLRSEMGHKGRQRVEALYDWEKCVSIMIEIYKSMIKRRKKI